MLYLTYGSPAAWRSTTICFSVVWVSKLCGTVPLFTIPKRHQMVQIHTWGWCQSLQNWNCNLAWNASSMFVQQWQLCHLGHVVPERRPNIVTWVLPLSGNKMMVGWLTLLRSDTSKIHLGLATCRAPCSIAVRRFSYLHFTPGCLVYLQKISTHDSVKVEQYL